MRPIPLELRERAGFEKAGLSAAGGTDDEEKSLSP